MAPALAANDLCGGLRLRELNAVFNLDRHPGRRAGLVRVIGNQDNINAVASVHCVAFDDTCRDKHALSGLWVVGKRKAVKVDVGYDD